MIQWRTNINTQGGQEKRKTIFLESNKNSIFKEKGVINSAVLSPNELRVVFLYFCSLPVISLYIIVSSIIPPTLIYSQYYILNGTFRQIMKLLWFIPYLRALLKQGFRVGKTYLANYRVIVTLVRFLQQQVETRGRYVAQSTPLISLSRPGRLQHKVLIASVYLMLRKWVLALHAYWYVK